MGRWHAHAIARAGGTVVAIVDPQRERASRLANVYPGARTHGSVPEVLAKRDLDVLHICTPLATHGELAIEALTAGVHVLVEKPLAPTAAVTADVLRVAEAHGVMCCPVHQLVFQPGVLRAQAKLGPIAPIRHVEFTACSAGAEGGSAEARDAVAASILVHPLSLLARLFPALLPSIPWSVQRPLAGELCAMGCADGVSVALLVSTHGRPTINQFSIIGEGGTVHINLFHGFTIFQSGAVSRTRKALQPFLFSASTFATAACNLTVRALRGESAYPGLRELVRRFYAAVRHGGNPPISAAEVLAVARAGDALLARAAAHSEPAP